MAGLKGKLRDTSRSDEIVEALDGLFAKAGVIPEVRKKILGALQTMPPVPGLALGAARGAVGSGAAAGAQRVMQEATRDAPGPLRGDPRLGPKIESTIMGGAETVKGLFDAARRGDFSQ